MSTVGMWLTGSTGAARVETLARTLNSKSLAIARSRTQTSCATYLPWMSSKGRLEVFSNLAPWRSDRHRNGPIVVSDPDDLRRLHDALKEGDSPLQYLGIQQNNGMCVEISDLERVRNFASCITRSVNWLHDVSPAFQRRLKHFALEIIPLGLGTALSKRRREGRGLSSHHYRGGIFMDLPETDEHPQVELTINLAHELGHQVLMVYQNADEIIRSDHSAPVYSAIRRTYRPAIRSFHALAALASMLEFVLCALRSPVTSKSALGYLKRRRSEIAFDLTTGLSAFRESNVQFTELGQAMFRECEELQSRTLAGA